MGYHKVTMPTRDELAALIDKLTEQQIAEHFGVSRSCISVWKRKYKLHCHHRGRMTPQIDEMELRAMVEDGSTLASIAKRLGCDIRSVVAVLERLGIRTRGQIVAAGEAKGIGQAVIRSAPSASALFAANPFGL